MADGKISVKDIEKYVVFLSVHYFHFNVDNICIQCRQNVYYVDK